MKTFLIPKSARLIPTGETKNFHKLRNQQYGPDKFKCYNDWFYFIHVDPYLRWIHAMGMILGLILYFFSAYKFFLFGVNKESIGIFFSGVFFFYFLPLISHYFYEGRGQKPTPDKFHSTLIPVIHINLMTLTGRYDKWLKKFIIKYPFTSVAWQLEERQKRNKIY